MSPKPGTLIAAAEVSEYAHMLDEALAEQLSAGEVQIAVGESFSIAPHAAYVAATRQHQGLVQLGDALGELLGYVAGRPFVGEPDLNDPRAGEKIAWNMRHAFGGDGALVPEMHWYYRDMRREKLERTLEFTARRLLFKHRTVTPPVPEVEKNSQALASALYLKAEEPPDVAGTALLMYYNEDDREAEQAWMYVPILRRVRRVATQQKTDAFLGSDIMVEDFLGYSGRIMDMKWSYIGERHVLLPIYKHDRVTTSEKKARKYDYHFVDFHGRANCYPNVTWQLRRVYVLDGEPLRDDHPISRRRFYVDAQTYIAPYGLIFDRAGALWKIGIGGISHPDHHLEVNHGSAVPLLDSSVMIDVQARHCTTIQMVNVASSERLRARDFHPGILSQEGR